MPKSEVYSMDTSGETKFSFAELLEQSFEQQHEVKPRDVLKGIILAIDHYGAIIDVGLKRDAVVPRSDLDALDEALASELNVGDEVSAMVITPEDRDGNLIVSIQQAIAVQDWHAAQTQMAENQIIRARAVSSNRGGLLVPYGELRGFIPASHLVDLERGLSEPERVNLLHDYVGRILELKIIEVTPHRRRLVFSEKEALKIRRTTTKQQLLRHLEVGSVVQGRVSTLRDFGAFVDIGGADGLVHLSEIAWHRISHPKDVLEVGECIDVYILQLDEEQKRIGLSIKRLKENPWAELKATQNIGDIVDGNISRVVSFGAFVELADGIEALLHISEMAVDFEEPLTEHFHVGDAIRAKIVSFEPERQRMGLSLKGLNEEAPVENQANEDSAETGK